MTEQSVGAWVVLKTQALKEKKAITIYGAVEAEELAEYLEDQGVPFTLDYLFGAYRFCLKETN